MRSCPYPARFLLLCLVLAACSEDEPAPLDASDTGRPDAALDGSLFDGELDSQVDSQVDARTDAAASCDPERILSCPRTGLASVACGSLLCTGETPVCCQHGASTPTVDPSCIAVGAPCVGSIDPTHNIRHVCDDADDCERGLVCRDGFNKGLGHLSGARCDPVCKAQSLPYVTQQCSSDCECGPGMVCTNRVCIAQS